MRQAFPGDKALIGRVKQQNRPVFQGIIHPGLQLLSVIYRTCGIVGRAQVDDVSMYVFLRQGQKTIILVGVEIENLPTGNQVGVHIYGVHRVRYQHCVIHVEQIHNVAHIAFCSVSYEYLGGIQIHTEALIISGNGFPQERIAVAVRRITPKGLFAGHLVRSPVHGFNYCRSQRLCYIADSHFDDLILRMRLPILSHLLGDGHKEIALL